MNFLGLHERLVSKYLHLGRIVPPAPEKSVLGKKTYCTHVPVAKHVYITFYIGRYMYCLCCIIVMVNRVSEASKFTSL